MTVRPKALTVADPIVNQGRFIMNVIFIRQEKKSLVIYVRDDQTELDLYWDKLI
jgi:hypothetical protein